MRRSPIIVATVVLTAAFALACAGGGGGASGGGEQVAVKVSEFKFEGAPASLKVGQKYKFNVSNGGTVEHEFMILPRGSQDMSKALLSIATKDLQPGKSASAEATFDKPGEYEIACHVPGHYEAGMHQNITIG